MGILIADIICWHFKVHHLYLVDSEDEIIGLV